MKKITSLFVGLSFCLNLYTQTIHTKQFKKEIFCENFNSDNSTFSNLVNSENYIIVDDGDLFLNRTNPLTHHIIFSNNIIKSESYRIKTAIKNGPSTKRNSYAGIVMNTPINGSETIAVEINGKQEYRIRKITAISKFLSGTESNDGWVKSKYINKNEVYNYIDVISNRGKYDLFINDKHITSFGAPEHISGGFGFIIGPNSQARINYIIFYEQEKESAIDLIKIETQLNNLTASAKKYEVLEKENNNLKQQLTKTESLKKQNEMLIEKNNKLTTLKKENKILAEKLKKTSLIENENMLLKEKLNDYSDLKKENKALNQKIGLLAKLNEENIRLKNDMKNNTQSVISSKNELIITTKHLADVETKLQRVTKEKELLISENHSLTEEKNNLDSQLKTTTNQLKSIQNTNVQLESDKKSLNTKILENKDVKAKLVKVKSENQDFKNRVFEMEEINSNLNKEIKALKTENKDYQKTKEEYENIKLTLLKTNTQLKKKNNELEKMKEKYSSLEELQVKLSELKDHNSTLSGQLNVLNSKYERLKNNEESIQNSIVNYSESLTLNKSINTAKLTNEYLKSKHNEIQQLKSNYNVLEKRNDFLEKQHDILVAQNDEQKLIAYQFAESFQLEKQKNKQLQNEIMSLYSEEEASENSKDVVYRVQLGIFDTLIDVEGIKDLTTIHTQAQQVIYIAGKFDDFSSARDYLLEMSKKGFDDAFIVKF